MKLRQLMAGVPLTGGCLHMEMEIYSISYKSSRTQPGAIYVALVGEQRDGHDHIAEALERGAVSVVCQREGEGPRLLTEDSRLALALMSANWFSHPGEGMTLLGVTGTNGKTTTTHLLKAILEGAVGAKVGLIGTNHVMIGGESLPAHRTTPESYEIQCLLRYMADMGCTHVVMEVSSHALVQHRVAGLTFQVGIFTNLTQDHLDYHHTMEEYRRAKGLLFPQCHSAVLNLDDEAGRFYSDTLACPLYTYSESHDEACLTAKNVRLFHSHVEFEAVARG